jgi:muramoyltetrapeptide carboxypeptidase
MMAQDGFQIVRTKPRGLRSGDTVGIVAPASNISRELLEKGCEALRRLGYVPVYLDSIVEQDLYFAGTAERRARELEEMFTREEVKGIICARGGYGANYLLSKLDPGKIVAHPKIFVGYSDLTTLETCFTDSAGFVTFHGPMVTKDFALDDGVDLVSWNAAVGGVAAWEIGSGSDSGMEGLIDGESEGTIYGGCLTLLLASLGTPHEIRTAGTILFMEDLNTKPYQVDRMLMQLKLAGKFKGVRGIVFGQMLGCVQTADQGYALQQVVSRIVGDLGVPVAYGLRSGHVTRKNITLPIGVRGSLSVNGKDAKLKILEAATIS